jgi:hypothetical protein
VLLRRQALRLGRDLCKTGGVNPRPFSRNLKTKPQCPAAGFAASRSYACRAASTWLKASRRILARCTSSYRATAISAFT